MICNIINLINDIVNVNKMGSILDRRGMKSVQINMRLKSNQI